MAYRLKRRSQRAEEGADVLGELLRGFKSGEVAAREGMRVQRAMLP
jgi:hypothetical protein